MPNSDTSSIASITLASGSLGSISIDGGDTYSIGIVEQSPIAVSTYSDALIVLDASGESGGAVFRQEVAAKEWVFSHNLNRTPIPHCTDLAGHALLVDLRITSTQVFVYLDSPATGVVYLK